MLLCPDFAIYVEDEEVAADRQEPATLSDVKK